MKIRIRGTSRLRLALLAVGAAFLCFLSVEAFHYLPRGEVVVLTGAQNMRFSDGVDDGADHGQHGKGVSRDVRLIYARSHDGDKTVRTYRNEDVTAYLKFDSGTVNSEVQSILLDQTEKGKPIPVLVLYYGWRVSFLSWYPNIISLRVVSDDFVYWPWHMALVVLLVLGGLGAIAYFTRRGLLLARAKAGTAARSVSEGIRGRMDGIGGKVVPPVSVRNPVPDLSSER